MGRATPSRAGRAGGATARGKERKLRIGVVAAVYLRIEGAVVAEIGRRQCDWYWVGRGWISDVGRGADCGLHGRCGEL